MCICGQVLPCAGVFVHVSLWTSCDPAAIPGPIDHREQSSWAPAAGLAPRGRLSLQPLRQGWIPARCLGSHCPQVVVLVLELVWTEQDRQGSVGL